MRSDADQLPTMILEKNGTFYCAIKDLSLIESGDDLLSVYKKIQDRKREVLSQLKAAHLEGYLISQPVPEQKKSIRRFATFVNFILIACVLMIPIVSVTLPLSKILTRCAGFLQFTPIEFMIKAGEHLENMPPQKKEELRKSIKALVSEYRHLCQQNESGELIHNVEKKDKKRF